ncbi:MAG TPA: hypothetical protein VFT72_04440 [Opitutaceae bacterium]|nr:hypothetical protein [Opitutaceae bacterium]
MPAWTPALPEPLRLGKAHSAVERWVVAWRRDRPNVGVSLMAGYRPSVGVSPMSATGSAGVIAGIDVRVLRV